MIELVTILTQIDRNTDIDVYTLMFKSNVKYTHYVELSYLCIVSVSIGDKIDIGDN